MSTREQTKYFESLKRFENKFSDKESSEYKMFKKRHIDEEDLDKLSLEKLKALYNKYYVNRVKKDLSGLFKNSDTNENI